MVAGALRNYFETDMAWPVRADHLDELTAKHPDEEGAFLPTPTALEGRWQRNDVCLRCG